MSSWARYTGDVISSEQPKTPGQYRSLFLSDIHLGTRGCQAALLLDFLKHHQAERIYLIGDIVDGWRLQRGWHWPQAHNDVVQELLARASAGVEIIYIPGNHDEVMRKYLGTHFGGIEVMDRAVAELADGRRFLVTHGDQFDSVVVNAKWLAHIGDWAYVTTLWFNTWLNKVRWLWGGQYWSLANWAKQQVKRAVNYISEYEKVLSDEAQRGGYDGVICGHIHKANITKFGEMEYVNTGDWVESCTAVVEEPDGTLRLIDWVAKNRRRELRAEVEKNGKRPKGKRKGRNEQEAA